MSHNLLKVKHKLQYILNSLYFGGFESRNAISICTARYGRYVPVHQVTGVRTVRYPAVPSKSIVGGRLREKSTVGGRLREKKKEEEEEKKKEEEEEKKKEVPRFPMLSLPSLAGDFSPARGDGTSPRA
ncbi:hypothetical protein BHM03_00032840, partial [Ensete ventricosum]